MHMKKWTAAAIGVVLAVSAAGAAVAHHSFATEFDRNKPIRLEGKVVKFEWVNPHSWISPAHRRRYHVAGRGRRPERSAPPRLEQNSLPAGTDIIVDAFRARDGDTRASAAEIRFPNGRELSLGNPTTEAVQRQRVAPAETEPTRPASGRNETGGARGRVPRALSIFAALRRSTEQSLRPPLVGPGLLGVIMRHRSA
jgi:hypothetical protein